MFREDLDRFHEWYVLSDSKLNYNKCNFLRFHKLTEPIESLYVLDYRPFNLVHESNDSGEFHLECASQIWSLCY